jgi:hypothetical protein
MGIFERSFSSGQENILEMNMEIISTVLGELGSTTRIIRMSDLGIDEKGTRLIVDICLACNATHYLVQESARKWLDGILFERSGIEVIFYKPTTRIYPQLWGLFVPDLSIFDLLFICGPKAKSYMG